MKVNIKLDWLVQIVFITLKLCKVITWSWWLVMLPTLIPLGFALVVFGIIGTVALFRKFK